jgi:hypothetical protein
VSKDHETKTMLCDQQLEVGGGKEGFRNGILDDPYILIVKVAIERGRASVKGTDD